MKSTKKIVLFLLSGAITMGSISCDKPAPKEEEVVVEPIEVVEEDILIIDEITISDMPVATMKAAPKDKTVAKKSSPVATTDTTTKMVSQPLPAKHVDSILTKNNYVSTVTVDETMYVIPLEETQTIVSYNKKGVEKESFQMVSDGNGDVEYIVFTNKKHKDIYNVQAGMSGKEVKEMRKELKHMVKNGQVFLYDDQSNVMYLLDAKVSDGQEIEIADVDTMEVTAIIWKDKKHHKKSK